MCAGIKDTVEKEIGPPTWHLYTITPTYNYINLYQHH